MRETSTNIKRVDIKGLPNIGNTCFMNAILQCLIWTPNFQENLQKQENELKNKGDNSGQITHSLLEIVKKAHHIDSTRCFLLKLFLKFWKKMKLKGDLETFLKDIRRINDQFKGFCPQDSYEMFNTIIPGLEDEFLNDEERTENDDDKWKRCPTSGLFGGMFRTVYEYPCGHSDEVNQRFTSISIPVRENGMVDIVLEVDERNQTAMETSNVHREIFSVEDGLKDIIQKEKFSLRDLPCPLCTPIDDDNGFCVKQLLVHSPPEILVIHINRFKQESEQLVKIQGEVSYQENLDLSPFVMRNDQDKPTLLYSLYGVVCHDGPITGGHYFALIKSFQDKEWFYVSDLTVRPRQNPLGERGAYMLMYQRIH